jgi:hypothetical protein
MDQGARLAFMTKISTFLRLAMTPSSKGDGGSPGKPRIGPCVFIPFPSRVNAIINSTFPLSAIRPRHLARSRASLLPSAKSLPETARRASPISESDFALGNFGELRESVFGRRS